MWLDNIKDWTRLSVDNFNDSIQDSMEKGGPDSRVGVEAFVHASPGA